ncbi:MAG TPA: hopanoid-associated sugar epimerase [Gammaproteobacteria bacterium]|nr:hopanoid-associated sugar epimerase [Gammaproteobacteria bacterium]
MTTLITGATGFVGSAVLRHLLEAGYPVRALVRPRSDPRNLADLPVERIEGDLTDAGSLRRALEGCDALFHVAADYRLWTPDTRTPYRVNVDGSRALMHAALDAGVRRIVYTSSVAVLGLHADGSPADENTPVSLADMIGHYKRSKYLAEEAVRELVRTRDLPAVIVNPSTPVGPRDTRPTPTGQMIRDAAAGRMPAYVDTGLNIVHVDDVAAGHLLAYEHGRPGERYVLGGDDMTLQQILSEISRLSGRRPPRVRLAPSLILPVAYAAEAWASVSKREPLVTVTGVRLARKRMFFSSRKAREQLGYAARPAGEALADAVRWFRGGS